MNKPYYPSTDYSCYVVKVYNNKDRSVCWLDRWFLNIKNIINSYTHKHNSEDLTYIVYEYPSYSFVELLTYTDSHVRVEIDTPEASKLAGAYTEGWGIVKE